jgi:hypothetical protein
LKGGNDLNEQNDLDDRTEQEQAGCGNSQSGFMERIPGYGDIGEMDGDVISSPWVLVTRKSGNKET